MTKTTSYEISKKLKEAGFETSYVYAWYTDSEGSPWIQEIQHVKPTAINRYGKEVKLTFIAPAYDLETILDALPKINKQEYLLCSGGIAYLNDDYISIGREENESLADTAGKMWLLLKERGLIC